jgi:hypothetical protein
MNGIERKKSKSRRRLVVAGGVAVGLSAFAVYTVVADRPPGENEAVSSAVALPPIVQHSPRGHEGRHPAPRPGVGPEHIADPAQFERYPRVASVYRAAATNPQLLDGLYCYCQCKEHARHYSLLDCFASDHAAMCDVCTNEAETAIKLAREGVELEGIRDIIDQLYGG